MPTGCLWNVLTSYRSYANAHECFRNGRVSSWRCVPRDLKVNETDAEYLVRKFDALEAKCAAQENKVIPVSTELPPANESVLLFDANGEGWLIGWRSLVPGQKETGEWQWTFQVGDLENVNITHWAVMPKAPEAGA